MATSLTDVRSNCSIVTEHYGITKNDMGTFVYNLHDPCILSCMEVIPQEVNDLSQFIQGTVLDIGANIGIHTIGFSKHANWVYSFEPQPLAYFELCTNLLLNTVHNVTPIKCALGNTDGLINMPDLDPTVPNSCAGIAVDQGDMPVPIRKLDSMEVPEVHFIKIDVEGYEVEVIKGAIETLKKHNPIVFIEVHQQEHVQPLKDIFTSLGYEYKQFNSQGGYPIAADGVSLEPELVVLTLGYLFWTPGKIVWKEISQ